MKTTSPEALACQKSWRVDAARIVEELFSVTHAEAWDDLLELRQNLLEGADWNHTLDLFLVCREKLEAEHYLPFYRLRRLLAGSLKLEAHSGKSCLSSLQQILRRKHRSLADIRKAVSRELFEHDLDGIGHDSLDLRVVER